LDGIKPYYINITYGKSIEDAKNEMLYNDNVNKKNSTIKTGIEAWYKKYIFNDFDQYVEDTIYCNNRNQSNSRTNGWNPNGGSVKNYMYFKEYYVSSDLRCPNDTDKFSTLNNKAQLTYKVGLASAPEMDLLNSTYLRKTGKSYMLASPTGFLYNNAYGDQVGNDGGVGVFVVYYVIGVRPVISLIPGIDYVDGDGSMEHPYRVDDGTN
jgi:hypothetical protein